MSVYIKGMEMPKKKNGAVLIIYPDGTAAFEDGVKYNVVPVPDHGKLIDATAKVQTQLYDDEHEEWTDVEMTVDEYLGYCHNEVPTIIPAEPVNNSYKLEGEA